MGWLNFNVGFFVRVVLPATNARSDVATHFIFLVRHRLAYFPEPARNRLFGSECVSTDKRLQHAPSCAINTVAPVVPPRGLATSSKAPIPSRSAAVTTDTLAVLARAEHDLVKGPVRGGVSARVCRPQQPQVHRLR